MMLVYVRGMKYPQPQLWAEIPTNGAGQPLEYLQCTELTLDMLSKAFPYIPKKDPSDG